jgi:L-threonylcarbamoyladenylate synthase
MIVCGGLSWIRAANDLVLHQAVLAIRRGGVVAMPTDTVYGLAVDPFRAEAVERLFAVKGRDASQALLLIAADVDQVRTWIEDLPPLAAVSGRGSGRVR